MGLRLPVVVKMLIGFGRYRDKRRGIFNEGGLFGERNGWHLPHSDVLRPLIDKRVWSKRNPSSGLPSTSPYARLISQGSAREDQWVIAQGGHAGVGFFRTTFELHERPGYDVMMSFVFEDGGAASPPYRALLFVNGWQMGKRVGNLG